MTSLTKWRTSSNGLRLVNHSDDDACDRFINTLRNRGHRVYASSTGWYRALCPGHGDRRPSLTFKYTRGRLLVRCFYGCSLKQIFDAIGWKVRDLYDEPYTGAASQTVVATFENYVDPDGRSLVGQVRKLRFGPRRSFAWQRREASAWIYGLARLDVGLFNLDGVRGAAMTFWVEGEGVVETAVAHGFPAVCSAHGASANAILIDRLVATLQRAAISELIVLPDHDRPGRAHASAILTAAHKLGLVAKLIHLPKLPAGGDLVNWFNAGHSSEDLRRLIVECSHWTPEAAERERNEHRRSVDRARLQRWRQAKREAAAKPAARTVEQVASA
jgi:hypothetical protein